MLKVLNGTWDMGHGTWDVLRQPARFGREHDLWHFSVQTMALSGTNYGSLCVLSKNAV